jgi:hypothetical protein
VFGRFHGGGALEVAELDLDEGVDGAGGGRGGEVQRLHDVHVEEPHRFDEVVGGVCLARAGGRGGGGVEPRDVEAGTQHGRQRRPRLHQPKLLRRRHRPPWAPHHERTRRHCALHLVGGVALLGGERGVGGVGSVCLLCFLWVAAQKLEEQQIYRRCAS